MEEAKSVKRFAEEIVEIIEEYRNQFMRRELTKYIECMILEAMKTNSHLDPKTIENLYEQASAEYEIMLEKS